MSLPAWIARYVGIPYKPNGRDLDGCDCYGLLALVLWREFHCYVPPVEPYPSAPDLTTEAAARLSEDERIWLPCMAPDPEPGDALLFRVAGLPVHCGLYVGDGRFLHTQERCNAVAERMDGTRWRLRLHAIYRHRDMTPGRRAAHA
jgi:cell wall-associated NlpC family hydrolase